jgi:branched-chain amino acid aminotransferase
MHDTRYGYLLWDSVREQVSCVAMRVLIDGGGVASEIASISVFDQGLLRGDGCFEAVRSYGGSPFAMSAHLDRLERSARLLELELPPRSSLEEWVLAVAGDGGDCTVRVVVTRGGIDPAVPSRVVVLWESLPDVPAHLSLVPLTAPWHPDGAVSELTGAKTLSYAPNMAAGRAARRAGFDDALLIGQSGRVLEGPTFSVAWVVDAAIETPSLDLGILASITRETVLRIASAEGIDVREGHYETTRFDDADEALAFSTVKEVRPVVRVGGRHFTPGPVTGLLARRYRELVAASPSA